MRPEVFVSDWKLPDDVDRMAVNAALTTLTEHWDESAAHLVIAAFHTLPPYEGKSERWRSSSWGDRTSVTGHTRELGNVQISTDEKREMKQKSGNRNVARIGSFKLHRWAEDPSPTISFQAFWEAEISSQGQDPPPFWELSYDAGTRAPLALTRFDMVPTSVPLFDRTMAALFRLLGGSFETRVWKPVGTALFP